MPETKKILVVDDEPSSLELLDMILTEAGYVTSCVNSAKEALVKISEDNYDVVITDIQMPEMDGRELTERVVQISPDVPIIILTAFASIESAVEMTKKGAYDYLKKPFDKKELLVRVEKAVEKSYLTSELRQLRDSLKKLDEHQRIIGDSKPMREVMAKVSVIAKTEYPVVIYGESGTGKELIARSIHAVSQRAFKPFVSVNCVAIPDTLFENELFGHAKGAYTGADTHKKGLFEEAEGGSIFLDEIGDVSLPLQVKLLRVLQNREIKKLGETKTTKVDVRLITATNRDLTKSVDEGTFREDLFYRINVIPITVPPLRERKEDIPLLSNHFLRVATAEMGKSEITFDEGAMQKLLSYSWPGNVRELENKIKQAAIMAKGGTVRAANIILDEAPKGEEEGESELLPFKEARARFERDYIIQLLQKNGGNIKKTAEEMGKYRSDLYALIKKYDIKPDNFR